MATLLSGKNSFIVQVSNGASISVPNPELINKFEFLHFFLEETMNDWKRVYSTYQKSIDDAATNDIALIQGGVGFVELQPLFLKCIFTYAMFFWSTNAAYEQLYSQLNNANRLSELFVKHNKQPKKNAVVEKVIKVRNWSIVHLNDTNADELTERTAMSWQPLQMSTKLGTRPHFDNMIFGAKFVRRKPSGEVISESEDLTLPGIADVHRICMDYLEEFDRVCTDYFNALEQAGLKASSV